jgi:DnaJ-class molecular chaperone
MRRKFLTDLPYRWAPVNDKEKPIKVVKKIICPICKRKGMVIDKKTRNRRQCVACQGVGLIKI